MKNQLKQPSDARETNDSAEAKMKTADRSSINDSSNTNSRGEEDETDASDEKKKEKNRPKASLWRQQRLPAWRPVLTANVVIPGVFLLAAVMMPIGIALVVASESVQQESVRYTNCNATDAQTGQPLGLSAGDLLIHHPEYLQIGLKCQVTIYLREHFQGDVYFYYGLENFAQNHRRYFKSRSDSQLTGSLDDTSNCEPNQYENNDAKNGRKIAPCGAIANSVFNDSFRLLREGGEEVPWTTEDVIFSYDRESLFKNPKVPTGQTLCDVFKNYARPPNWQTDVCNLGAKQNGTGVAFENVDFIIWMRTAMVPSFRKLYRRLDRRRNPIYAQGLPAGLYTLEVDYKYPVKGFNGKKHFIISTTSWAGGRNHFLGIAYIVVSFACLVLAVVFLVMHMKYGFSVTDHGYIRTGSKVIPVNEIGLPRPRAGSDFSVY